MSRTSASASTGDVPAAVIDLMQCPACGGGLHGTGGDLHCIACARPVRVRDGIVDFVDGTESTQLDNIDYDTFYQIDDHHANTTYATIAATAGPLWPASIGDAVEIGCGTGGFSMAMLARMTANRVLLTDVSVKMLAICQDRMQRIRGLKPAAIGYTTWSTRETPFRGDSFDTCYGTAVVHHILDVPFFLRQVHRALKPGGVAFFMEPNAPFHQALIATLADIVAAWLPSPDGRDMDLARMMSWIGEVHCNVVNSGDLDVLADREDKHLFTGTDFVAMANDAGFDAVALACGPDPTGVSTIESVLGQVGVSARTMPALLSEWNRRQGAYFGRLKQNDRAPSYLFWLRKADTPKRRRRRRAATDRNKGTAVPLLMWLTLRLEPSDSGCDLAIDGWCLGEVAVRAIEVEWGGTRRRIPVWRPRPDVQQVVNPNATYPNLHALCSGVDARLPVGRMPGDRLELQVTALCSDGSTVRRGSVTLRAGDEPVTVR